MEFSVTDILKFYVNIMDNKNFLSDEEILRYVAENYNFDGVDPESQTILLINNFLLVYSTIMNDLKEITERIEYIDKKIARLASKDYEFKKLNYFKGRNIEAKIEIEKFLMYNVAEYVKKCVADKKRWTNSPSTGSGETLGGLPYRYSYYRRYYNPQYDFSTESKFRFLLENDRRAIDIKIETRKDSPIRYSKDVDRIIKSEGLLKKMVSKVEGHHRLKNRIEIFETLYRLYEDGLYQSFINLAVIQIEGLFYDFCIVINDEQEIDNMGTLCVKAEKIFKSNFVLWLSVYPHFAFEVPIFRNRIAHKGLWNEYNPKNFANELILDLNTILEMIKLPYIPPNNLLVLFESIRQKIAHLEFTEDDYETILAEIFTTIQSEENCTRNVFTLLKERETKRELFEYYIIPILDGACTNLYEECNRLTGVIHNEKFWDIVLMYMQKVQTHNSGNRYDFISFVKLMTDNYIGEFEPDTPMSEKCLRAKKELEKFNTI